MNFNLFKALSVGAIVLCAPAFAENTANDLTNMPGLLVIRVNVNQKNDTEENAKAYFVNTKMDVTDEASAKEANQLAEQSQSMDIDLTQSQTADTPAEVKKIFEQAEQESASAVANEVLSTLRHRYWNYYRSWPSRWGFWGYGYPNYYGYHRPGISFRIGPFGFNFGTRTYPYRNYPYYYSYNPYRYYYYHY
jgi:hypothetical protein